jgi:hypothetical protein
LSLHDSAIYQHGYCRKEFPEPLSSFPFVALGNEAKFQR